MISGRWVDSARWLGYCSRTDGAQVAQLVEHATENRSVAGSIPALGTIHLIQIFDEFPTALH